MENDASSHYVPDSPCPPPGYPAQPQPPPPPPNPVSMNLEISPQHHAMVLGRGNLTLKLIMQRTNTTILFPDAADPNIPSIRYNWRVGMGIWRKFGLSVNRLIWGVVQLN